MGLLFDLLFSLLLIDLDDTEQNEKLKFSIVMRLPEVINGFRCNSLDFGIDRKFLLVQTNERLACDSNRV